MTQALRKPRGALAIDMMVESDRWRQSGDAAALARAAVIEAAAALSTARAELAIVLTDDSAMRALNRVWRGVDKATNVLSFPTKRAGEGPPLLGDIVLAYDTIAREARRQRKPFAHHVAHLAVHGFLHLLGYDHESHGQAETMERRERRILARLGVPDPYAERRRISRRSGRRFADKDMRRKNSTSDQKSHG
jgi:probable rRNA maturation factor